MQDESVPSCTYYTSQWQFIDWMMTAVWEAAE
jgi:hypothetical protein